MFMLVEKRIIVKNLHPEIMTEPTQLKTQIACLNFPWGGPTYDFAYFLSFTASFLASFYKQFEYSGTYKVSALFFIVQLRTRRFSFLHLDDNIAYLQS